MTVLPALERLLGDAAENLEPGPNRVSAGAWRAWWRGRSRRPLVLLAALVLAGCSAAWAAGVFQTGTPITTQPGYVPAANQGWGAPVPGSYRVLGLHVSDPAGGPAWGLGLFRTTQGLVCPAVGRIVRGQLGALGIDSAFADDRRFHRLLPAASIFLDCAPPDASGHVFLNGAGWLVSASGEVAPDGALTERPACRFPGDLSRGPRCARSEMRGVFYGFLGPDALTIRYTYRGVRHLERVSGPDGAYLVVLPAPAAASSRRAQLTGLVEPPTTIHVAYRGGRSCAIANLDCGPVGYQPGPLRMPPRSSLTTTATARFHTSLVVGLLPAGPATTVSFDARVAITNPRYHYTVRLRRPNTSACRAALEHAGGGVPLVKATSGTVRAGGRVTLALPLIPPCAGRYAGTVSLDRAPRWPTPFIGMDRLAVNRPASIDRKSRSHDSAAPPMSRQTSSQTWRADHGDRIRRRAAAERSAQRCRV